jgi:hypothetical protein
MSDNIIPFPKKHNPNVIEPRSIEEVEESVDMVRHVHIQTTLEQVMPMLFENLAIAGFQPVDENDFIKDGSFVVEAVRSFLNKIYCIDHPLQTIAEHIFTVNPDGSVEISEKTKITITQE